MPLEACRLPCRLGGGGVHRRQWHADGDTAHHCHPFKGPLGSKWGKEKGKGKGK